MSTENKDDEVATPPDPKLLRRRDTIYEDILGMMIRETEESVKRSMKLQTVMEHEEHRRRLPYQLFKKDLNKVINEVYYTNGTSAFDKDFQYSQFGNMATSVPCIGVDNNNLDCGENVILDIAPESTKLPFFCKVMIVNQGRVHERSAPLLVRDVCLQVGDSLIEKLFHRHANFHNVSMNTSRITADLEPHHAVEDPNVSFTTPRSHRVRRPSWCVMEEYYSIPFYQYKGNKKVTFHKGVNTYVSMGYTVDEFDSLYSSFNSTLTNNATTATNQPSTNQAVDTGDLDAHVKSTQCTNAQLLSPITKPKENNEPDVVDSPKKTSNSKLTASTTTTTSTSTSTETQATEIINVKPLVPSLTTAIKRKRNRFIHLVFSDSCTNTASIPINPPSASDIILRSNLKDHNRDNSILTLHMPGTPRDISIRYEDGDDIDVDDDVYYVKDATTETNDLTNYVKLDPLMPLTPILQISNTFSRFADQTTFDNGRQQPQQQQPAAKTLFKNSTSPKTREEIENEAMRIRKKYKNVQLSDNVTSDELPSPNNSNNVGSNAIGRILRQRYLKRTTGKDPMKFEDDFIPFSLHGGDSGLLTTVQQSNDFVTPDDSQAEQRKAARSNILQSTPDRQERVLRSNLKNASPRVVLKPPTSSRSPKRSGQYQSNDDSLPRSSNRVEQNIQDIMSPDISFEIDNNNNDELERLLQEYDQNARQEHVRVSASSGFRNHRSKNNSIGDALSISTIEPGEYGQVTIDPNMNNSFDLEFTSPNEQQQQQQHQQQQQQHVRYIRTPRGVSAYPEYTRYPLITRALNRSQDLNRSVPNGFVPTRAHSNESASHFLKSSSFIGMDANVRPSYIIQPKVVVDSENVNLMSKLKMNRKREKEGASQSFCDNNLLFRSTACHDVNTSFCPKCVRDSLLSAREANAASTARQQQQHQLQDYQPQHHFIEKENVVYETPDQPLSSRLDLERRIANILDTENDNTRYLLRSVISPMLSSRPNTSRSLPARSASMRTHNRPTRIGFNESLNQHHLFVETTPVELVDNSDLIRHKLKHRHHHHIKFTNDPKYYRIRHDKTLKLYKEPIPADILRHNFDDFATVSAAAAHSLTESGILLKQMNNILTTAEL